MDLAPARQSHWSKLRWYYLACLFEGGVGVIAVLLGWLLARPVLAGITWQTGPFFLGLAGVLPMWGVFLIVLKAPRNWARTIRRAVDDFVGLVFAHCSVGHLAGMSLLAGWSEELLFRELIQGELASRIDPWAGLALASLLFGLAHWITPVYAMVAALIGAYLGLLWIWTGNLLAPVTAHAVYDFAALCYLMRRGRLVSDALRGRPGA